MAMVGMWSTLPEELLQEIAKKLGMVTDFVRFRAVCKPWRFAVKPADLPPQLPWLILYSGNLNVRSFYNMGTGNVHALSLPEFHLKHFFSCSSDGWLIQVDKSHNLSLRQPLTRSYISLPPLISRGYLAGARLSCSPASLSACGRCTVLVWINCCNTQTLVSSQLKPDGQWSQWSTIPTLQPYVKDLVVSRDHENLYGIDNVETFHVGLKKNTLRMILRPAKMLLQDWFFTSLVELPSGELLLAVVFVCGKAGGPDTSTLEVYRLEDTRWMKIEGSSIYQDQAIFLSPCQSFSVSARGHWNAGHAYLADNNSITVFSLKDGSCIDKQHMHQHPEGRFRSCNSWFVPSLCL